jgi:hypothetical protein
MFQKIKIMLPIAVLMVLFFIPAEKAFAQQIQIVTCPDGFSTQAPFAEREAVCQDHQTGKPERDSLETEFDPSAGANFEGNCKEGTLTQENCGIIGYIVTFTNALSVMVGLVIVIMIAVGGVQYTMSGDDPNAVSAAKERIKNAIYALIFYIFAVAFLQWLIPGGVF